MAIQDLIVNFPQQRRNACIQQDRHKDKKAVHFETRVRVVIVERFAEENRWELWTTKNDRKRYAATLRSDVRAAREMLGSNTGTPFTTEQREQCIGIENFLSSSISRGIKENKKCLMDAVLAEQLRQKTAGVLDDHAIRRVSQSFSKYSRGMANIVATSCQ